MIAFPSYASLFLSLRHAGRELASGTGFIVGDGDGYFGLATARHCFEGRNADGSFMDPQQAVPTEVVVRHTVDVATEDNLAWVDVAYPLYHDGAPVDRNIAWYEDGVSDVAFLPLASATRNGIYLCYRLPPEEWDDAVPECDVADDVSIVGFPFRQTGGGSLGIWSRGTIASEPSVLYNGERMFLIDSRTRPGQSGSPVIKYSASGVTTTSDGRMHFGDGPYIDLLGVYVGRIDDRLDLGRVWHASVLWPLARRAFQDQRR